MLRMARLCLYQAKDTQWCWICGAAAGMGTMWAGPHMTCNECYARWHYFHNDRLIVDWWGLGRIRKQPRADTQPDLAPELEK